MISLAFQLQATQLVDSTLETTRNYWRKMVKLRQQSQTASRVSPQKGEQDE